MIDVKEEETAVEEVWTYIGRTRANSGKISYMWLDESGKTRQFTVPISKTQCPIGAKYRVVLYYEANNHVSIDLKKCVYMEMSHDVERIKEWIVRDAAERIAVEKDKLVKAEKRNQNTPVDTAIKELNTQYNKLFADQKSAFLAHIIERITRPTSRW